MTDYTELVNALRICSGFVENPSCATCGYSNSTKCKWVMMTDAAAAIEALQADMKTYGDTAFKEGYEMGFAAGEARAEERLEPRRGEIVRCRECKWSLSCGHISTRSYVEWRDWFCADGERKEGEG